MPPITGGFFSLNYMEKDKLLKSEIIFQGKIFEIKKDKVLLENGNEARRDIIVHKGACCAVPITKEGKIILVNQYRHAVGDFLLEIPGGCLETGENPKDCIYRELQEEIGYKPGNIEYIFKMYSTPGYSTEGLFCYICSDLEKSSLPCDEDENIEIIELSFDEFNQYLKEDKIKDGKTIACCLYAMSKFNK